MKRILVVEDDRMLSAGLCFALEADGYFVNAAGQAKDALALVQAREYDLAVLDVNLPDGSGFDLCMKIKKRKEIPVIFLTACDLESEQLRGFQMGADDYITKPFSMALFHKRVQAVLKRSGANMARELYNDGFLLVDFERLTAQKGGEALLLTPKEYKLLRLFVKHTGQVLTRQLLLENLWDNDGVFVEEHALTVNINRLRTKLEASGHSYIKTVYGMGYQWLGVSL